MATFTGFGSPRSGPVKLLHDEELIKQDLINHFYTFKGERVMDSEYGFIGWELIFELKSPGIKERIEQDARRIIKTDPRVAEKSITVIEHEHGFTIQIELTFVQLGSTSMLKLFFDQNTADAQL